MPEPTARTGSHLGTTARQRCLSKFPNPARAAHLQHSQPLALVACDWP